MSLLREIFRTLCGRKDSLVPWAKGRSSIYEHVMSHLHPSGIGLLPGGEILPDAETLGTGDVTAFVPGACDGLRSDGNVDSRKARRIYEALRCAVESGGAGELKRLYEQARAIPAIGYADSLLHLIVERQEIDAAGLYRLARFLVERSPDREPVKLGLALLGIFRSDGDRNLFLELGRHEEFTLYCAVALSRTQEDPDKALWELARSVSGWGRVQVVERLQDTKDPAIKRWLLSQGFRNQVMPDYLAGLCARTGGLAEALSCDWPDDELLDGACEIVMALVTGESADDMENYRDGAVATERLLGHLSSRASSLLHFCTVVRIRGFLDRDGESRPSPRRDLGWSLERIRLLVDRSNEIIGRPWWKEQVAASLCSDDARDYYFAHQAARVLNVPAFEHHLARLARNPMDRLTWYLAAEDLDDVKAGRLLAAAERFLPIDDIASGPAESLGLGEEYLPHACLGIVLQTQSSHPGRGVELVLAALESPVVRNRAAAVSVIAAWKMKFGFRRDYIDAALARLLPREPDADLRRHIKELLGEHRGR